MTKKLTGGCAIIAGVILAIDGFVRLGSFRSQFWEWLGYINTFAYAEIGIGALLAVIGLIILLQRRPAAP